MLASDYITATYNLRTELDDNELLQLDGAIYLLANELAANPVSSLLPLRLNRRSHSSARCWKTHNLLRSPCRSLS